MRLDPGMGEETIIENSNAVYAVEGELRVGTNIVGSRDLINQYQQGYRCMQCHGVQDEPFPEVCKYRDRSVGGTWACGYRMRAEQAERFAKEFNGEQWYGPSPDDGGDYEREFWKPAGDSRIWVPRNIKE